MATLIDLHMHSSVSDGVRTPKELVDVAEKKGITVMSLTDHDSVAGTGEAMTAAEEKGIGFISGIELSCFDKKDTHVLGYNVDWRSDSFNSVLEELRQSRAERMIKMVKLLQNDGFDIGLEEVEERCGGEVMGRPHIAEVMVEKGYGRDNRDVFERYIGNGKKYYVSYKKLEVKDGIRLIHEAGGRAVLAHPKLLRYNSRDFTALLKGYKDYGLDGIEVYYPCHYDEHIRLFGRLAKELDLLVTCGGDYHNDHDRTKNTMGFKDNLPWLRDSVELLLKEAVK